MRDACISEGEDMVHEEEKIIVLLRMLFIKNDHIEVFL